RAARYGGQGRCLSGRLRHQQRGMKHRDDQNERRLQEDSMSMDDHGLLLVNDFLRALVATDDFNRGRRVGLRRDLYAARDDGWTCRRREPKKRGRPDTGCLRRGLIKWIAKRELDFSLGARQRQPFGLRWIDQQRPDIDRDRLDLIRVSLDIRSCVTYYHVFNVVVWF